jgi:hypothetical protein
MYATAVDGGYSLYDTEKRAVIEVFVKKEEVQ